MATKKPTKKSSNVEPPIPAPPRGSRSMRSSAMYSRMYDIPQNLDNENRRMRAARIQNSTHRSVQTTKNMKAQGIKLSGYKNTVEQIRGAKAGGRAQPKGTAPRTATPRTPTALPPRSGASSGGSSSMYNRLTGGGLPKHGR